MGRKVINTPGAPRPLGAYSQAIAAGGLVFTAGQLAIDPATGKLIEGDVRAQLRRAIENIRNVLQAAGLDLQHVAKVTVFLADIAEAKAANEAYSDCFRSDPPARTTVGAALPPGAAVEIDAVAVRGDV